MAYEKSFRHLPLICLFEIKPHLSCLKEIPADPLKMIKATVFSNKAPLHIGFECTGTATKLELAHKALAINMIISGGYLSTLGIGASSTPFMGTCNH